MRLVALTSVLVILAAVPAPTLADSVSVQISVPVSQVLEGPTTLTLTGETPFPRTLTVKSNIPWRLHVAVITGRDARVQWRLRDRGSWQPLPEAGPMLTGSKGVHAVAVQLRLVGPSPGVSATLNFTLLPR